MPTEDPADVSAEIPPTPLTGEEEGGSFSFEDLLAEAQQGEAGPDDTSGEPTEGPESATADEGDEAEDDAGDEAPDADSDEAADSAGDDAAPDPLAELAAARAEAAAWKKLAFEGRPPREPSPAPQPTPQAPPVPDGRWALPDDPTFVRAYQLQRAANAGNEQAAAELARLPDTLRADASRAAAHVAAEWDRYERDPRALVDRFVVPEVDARLRALEARIEGRLKPLHDARAGDSERAAAAFFKQHGIADKAEQNLVAQLFSAGIHPDEGVRIVKLRRDEAGAKSKAADLARREADAAASKAARRRGRDKSSRGAPPAKRVAPTGDLFFDALREAQEEEAG